MTSSTPTVVHIITKSIMCIYIYMNYPHLHRHWQAVPNLYMHVKSNVPLQDIDDGSRNDSASANVKVGLCINEFLVYAVFIYNMHTCSLEATAVHWCKKTPSKCKW